MRTLVLIVAGLALLLLPSVASAGAREALVIGNAQYAFGVGPLTHPHQDASLIAAALKADGFHVTTVLDASRVGLLGAVRSYGGRLQAAGPGSIGFLYYSGHGVANPADARN